MGQRIGLIDRSPSATQPAHDETDTTVFHLADLQPGQTLGLSTCLATYWITRTTWADFSGDRATGFAVQTNSRCLEEPLGQPADTRVDHTVQLGCQFNINRGNTGTVRSFWLI